MNEKSFGEFTLELKEKKAYLKMATLKSLDNAYFSFDDKNIKDFQTAIMSIQDMAKNSEIDHFILFSNHPLSFGENFSKTIFTNEIVCLIQDLFLSIKNMEIETTVFLNGRCFGLFSELILNFKNIYLLSNCLLSFDHVKWGITPFAGGMNNLTAKLGVEKALDVLLTGRTLNETELLNLNFFDRKISPEAIYSPNILKEAGVEANWMNKILSAPSFIKEKINSNDFLSKNFIFNKSREIIIKKLKNHQEVSLKILNTIEQNMIGNSDFQKTERDLFFENYESEESQNLFNLMEQKRKIENRFSPHFNKIKAIKRISVVGLGTIGANMAWLSSTKGFRPLVKDKNQLGLEAGLYRMATHFKYLKEKKDIPNHQVDSWQRSITLVSHMEALRSVDLVTESIAEDFDEKIKVLKDLEENIKDETLLTTSSSSLSISLMANHLRRPQNFAGLHFFNPVYKIPMVEVISHDKVSKETLRKLSQFVVAMGKIPILVKDCPGLLVGRLLVPYFNEAIYLLEEGHTVEEVDKAALNFGMSIGPLRLMDELGMDFILSVAKTFYQAFGLKSLLSIISDSLVNNKMLGRKSGKGFYIYGGGKNLGPSPLIKDLFPKKHRKKLPQKTLEMRLIVPMINEASRLLSEGSVENPKDIDLASVLAIGFPDFRGGPLRFAQYEGIDKIVAVLEDFEQNVNAERFRPSQYLIELSKEGRGIFDGN